MPAGLLAIAVLVAVIQVAALPDVAPLAHTNPTTTAFISRYRAAGHPVAWQPVPLRGITVSLALAVLVSEDIGFFGHRGFEVTEMRDAMREAVQKRTAPRGASTITQQLAKNLWLSPSRNPIRKLKEAILTGRLERYLSKERILDLYLNVAEFGPGIYGAEAAAWQYFGKPAAGLTDHESALLAASLPRPSTWHPGSSSGAYLRQVEKVEGRMARAESLRRRFGLPPVDTTRLLPDSLLWWDSIPPETLVTPDSLAVPESLIVPESLVVPESLIVPDTAAVRRDSTKAVPDTTRPPVPAR